MTFDVLVMVLPHSEVNKADDSSPVVYIFPKEIVGTPDCAKVVRGVAFSLGWSGRSIRQLELTDPNCRCFFDEVPTSDLSVCVAVTSRDATAAVNIAKGVCRLLDLTGDRVCEKIISGDNTFVDDVVKKVVESTLRDRLHDELVTLHYTPKDLKILCQTLHQTEAITEQVYREPDQYLTVGSIFMIGKAVAASLLPQHLERCVVAFLHFHNYFDMLHGEPFTTQLPIFSADAADTVSSRSPMVMIVRIASGCITVIVVRKGPIGNPLWHVHIVAMGVHTAMALVPVNAVKSPVVIHDDEGCANTTKVIDWHGWGSSPSSSMQYVKRVSSEPMTWDASVFDGVRKRSTFLRAVGTTASPVLEKARE